MNQSSSSRIASLKQATLQANTNNNTRLGIPVKFNIDNNPRREALTRSRGMGNTVKAKLIPPIFESGLVGYMNVLYNNIRYASFDRELLTGVISNLVTEKTIFIIAYSILLKKYVIYSKTKTGFVIIENTISIDDYFTVSFGYGCIFINNVSPLIGYMNVLINDVQYSSYDKELSKITISNLLTIKTIFIIGYSISLEKYFIYSKTKRGFEIVENIILIDINFVVNFGYGCIFINLI